MEQVRKITSLKEWQGLPGWIHYPECCDCDPSYWVVHWALLNVVALEILGNVAFTLREYSFDMPRVVELESCIHQETDRSS